MHVLVSESMDTIVDYPGKSQVAGGEKNQNHVMQPFEGGKSLLMHENLFCFQAKLISC